MIERAKDLFSAVVFLRVLPMVVLMFAGACSGNKSPEVEKIKDSDLQEIFVPMDADRFIFKGCILRGREVDMRVELLDLMGSEDVASLIQEQSDFREVARVASREIALIEEQIKAIENVARDADRQRVEIERARSAEINLLWSHAVSATDQRFAERARRFQVMLASRLRDRGISWPESPVLLEPSDAADIFERESRKQGFWVEDEQWLERQWRGWEAYEEVWRETRARIRREVENVQTESLKRLIAVEEVLTRDTERISRMRERIVELTIPLTEAREAAAELEEKIQRVLESCSERIVTFWKDEDCDTTESLEGGLKVILEEGAKGKNLFLLLEDEAGGFFVSSLKVEVFSIGNEPDRRIVPLSEFLK